MDRSKQTRPTTPRHLDVRRHALSRDCALLASKWPVCQVERARYPQATETFSSHWDPGLLIASCGLSVCRARYQFVNMTLELPLSLRWRHNDHDGVSNHQPHGCLLNRLFRRRSKKTSKLCVTGLCVGNSPGTGEFPAQMASYAENVSIWWRHHVFHPDDLDEFEWHSLFKSKWHTHTHTHIYICNCEGISINYTHM